MQTYVVRIWVPAGEPEDREQVRGVVEHLGTGASQPFRDGAELLAFLHAQPSLRERDVEPEIRDGGAP